MTIENLFTWDNSILTILFFKNHDYESISQVLENEYSKSSMRS